MTTGQSLASATRQLADAGITTARLDSLILLEDMLGHDRSAILAHPERILTSIQEVELNKKIVQRATHLPLAYIRGKASFYGREFAVDSRVLVPRPETEAMINLLKSLPLLKTPKIADIGTGSGCLGLTAALEISNATVWLCDTSSDALAVAKANASKHKIPAHLLQTDLLEQAPQDFDVILVNLPYVPDEYKINQAASFEPKLALFGGTDGLDCYRRLFEQLGTQQVSHLITESLPQQHKSLALLAKRAGYQLAQTEGLAQYFRSSL